MKLTKQQKQQKQLEEWFNQMSVPSRARVVWCSNNDGTGYDEEKTRTLHEALELSGYSRIPEKFNNGYVINYKDVGKKKDVYADPWSGDSLIDPSDPLNELSEQEMALLRFRIKTYHDISKPAFETSVRELVKNIKDTNLEWYDVKEAFNKLPLSQKAFYQENIYFKKKDVIKPVDVNVSRVTSDSVTISFDREVTNGDIMNWLNTNYRYNTVGLNTIIANFGNRNIIIGKLYGLQEKGWVSLNLLEDASGGTVKLTSSGHNALGDTVVNKQKINSIKSERLHYLRVQKARMGMDTPVHVLMEIENIEKELTN
jgi:hypothetical protein